uniref:Ammonium transporter AmtB-like domain-containing protein n=1 Tax=Acrobeloides nanus TaxID=290746 RepID=A0A914DCJ7_9BILA
MVNTVLCGAWAALAYMFIHYLRSGKWTILLTINACLAGQVAACAGCNVMHSWAAAITGIGAGLSYLFFAWVCAKLKIDDPLDAFGVHFGGGFWGLISICFVGDKGILYGLFDHSIDMRQAGLQLVWQLICALAIILWSVGAAFIMFLIMKKLKVLRVSPEVEVKGLDIYKHGEAAYPLTAYGHGWDEIENVKDPTVREIALRKISQRVDCKNFKFSFLLPLALINDPS